MTWKAMEQQERGQTLGGEGKPKDLATLTRSSWLMSKTFFKPWELYACR
jgi:hypothetical protein